MQAFPLTVLLLLLLPPAAPAQDGNLPPEIIGRPALAPSPAVIGEDIRFEVEARDLEGDSLRYSWTFGDGTPPTPFSASPRATHRYRTPGRYVVFARVRDSLGMVSASFIHTVLASRRRSPSTATATLLLDRVRQRIWTVNPDNNSVACISTTGLKRVLEIPVGRNPRTLAQGPDGSIWVANQDDATLSVLDPASGGLLTTVLLPPRSRPYGIAFDPQGKAGFVTLEATGMLVKLDPLRRTILASLRLGPFPRAMAIDSAGGRVFVARFLSPADRGEVYEAGVDPFRLNRVIPLAKDPGPDGDLGGRGVPNYLGGLRLSPDGVSLWVPSKKDNTDRGLARDGLPLNFESTVRSILSRVDIGTGAEDLLSRIDLNNSEIPSAVDFSPDGDLLFTALQGNNAVTAINLYNSGGSLVNVPGVGRAPQGLLVDAPGKRLYVQGFLSRTVGVLDIGNILANTRYVADTLAQVPTVSAEALPAEVLRGKRVFHDAEDRRMNQDGYISCASCHLEGFSDLRTWDFTDRGEGLRKTASLLGRGGVRQGPVHWSANFDEIQDFEHDMRGPFGGTGFLDDAVFRAGTRSQPLGDRKAGLDPDLDALAAYVGSLTRVPPSPYRNPDGSLTPEAQAGKTLFAREDVGCAKCHVPGEYTDSRLPWADGPGAGALAGPVTVFPGAVSYRTQEGFLLHDVGTLKPRSGNRLADTLRGLDAPTLKGIWQTAPYLHDGSAATLLDVLTTANRADRHGKTSHLTPAEKEQLAAFLMQLDDSGTPLETGARQGKRFADAGPARPDPDLAAAYSALHRTLYLEWIPDGSGDPVRLSVYDGAGRFLKRFEAAPAGGSVVTNGRREPLRWKWHVGESGSGPSIRGVVLIRARQGERRMARSIVVH